MKPTSTETATAIRTTHTSPGYRGSESSAMGRKPTVHYLRKLAMVEASGAPTAIRIACRGVLTKIVRPFPALQGALLGAFVKSNCRSLSEVSHFP
jgi:hypothetical protein